MGLTSGLALLTAMIALALVPGPGVLVVVARSMSSGFRRGMMTTAGIVCGDYVFIVLTFFGLVAIADIMGSFFIWMKYLGAAYLIYLGVQLLVSNTDNIPTQSSESGSGSADFIIGFVTTLANPKAILFYVSFFPAFLDVTSVTLVDVSLILFIATLSVGGVMSGYAFLASRTHLPMQSANAAKIFRVSSGSILVGGGILLLLRKS